jgi:FADH2-dependent halogenase
VTSTADFTYDVAVIGGGPAGSTAAALLAAAGRRVVLFEKERFPRFHIGESLLPFNLDLFARLGVMDRLEACFVEKWGVQLLSSDGAVSYRIRFEEGFEPGHPMAFQVLRSRFDEMLLHNAAARGAEVHQEHTVVEAVPSHRQGCAVVARAADGSKVAVRARFLLDASGRNAFVASRRRLRVMTPKLRKAAVFAHYEGVERSTGRESGDIVLIFLRDGWFWMIPLPDARTSVGLVTDGSIVKSSGLSPAELLETSLERCPAARRRLRDATRVSDVLAESDYSYACREMAGDGYLLVGDAAAFIDPVFSTGVWLGMSSAEVAADMLVAALGRDDGSGRSLAPQTFADYERQVRRHVRTYLRLVSHFYSAGFMDLFLQPSTRFRIKEAVITLMAGKFDPPPSIRMRLSFFYLAVRLHRAFNLFPRVTLLRVLEGERPS